MTGVEIIATCAAIVASSGGVVRGVTRSRRARLVGVALLLLGWIGLALAIAPASIRDRWPLLLPVGAVALIVGWFVARLLIGRERWLLAAGALVLTLRVPVPVGGDSVMLLAPLYAVIALGVLVLL
ncbi:MAG: hypothetical protein JWN72_1429, partial [Thermoleophilia bacterium]|nr:hypothetical protein [Thermoleophilia bacterium]